MALLHALSPRDSWLYKRAEWPAEGLIITLGRQQLERLSYCPRDSVYVLN